MRFIESKRRYRGNYYWQAEPVLGWDNICGSAQMLTEEYKAYYTINSCGMNDDDIEDSRNSRIKIMAVGGFFYLCRRRFFRRGISGPA